MKDILFYLLTEKDTENPFYQTLFNIVEDALVQYDFGDVDMAARMPYLACLIRKVSVMVHVYKWKHQDTSFKLPAMYYDMVDFAMACRIWEDQTGYSGSEWGDQTASYSSSTSA